MLTNAQAKFQITLMTQKWIDRGNDFSLVRVIRLQDGLIIQCMSYDDGNWHAIADLSTFASTFEDVFDYIKFEWNYSGTIEVQP